MATEYKEDVIRPLQLNVPPRTVASSRPGKLLKAVVWPDIQAGFRRSMRTGSLEPLHDREALSVAVQLTRLVKPDVIVFLGDNLDLPDWSLKYVRSPEFYWTTQPAAVELAWWLAQVDAKEKFYLEGNHENRMNLLMQTEALMGFGLKPVTDLNGDDLMSVPRLLDLQALHISYVGNYPQGEVWLNRELRLIHGEVVRTKSGTTSKSVAEDLRHGGEGQGHIHRLELASKTGWSFGGASLHTAFSPGTLCRLDPGVVPGAKSRQNWQQGVAVIEYEAAAPYSFHVDLVPIHKGRALYQGNLVTAKVDTKVIERDTKLRLT